MKRQSLALIHIFAMPLTYLAIGLFTVGVFVLIIHNAFSLSASTRLTQLGIFASIGATPRQIKRSVLFEAFCLSAIPIPFGRLIGQFLVKLLLDYIYTVNTGSFVEPGSYTHLDVYKRQVIYSMTF